MEFGVQVGGDSNLAVNAARWAERQGLVAFARADHYLVHTLSGHNAGLYDTLIILAGLARATEADPAGRARQPDHLPPPVGSGQAVGDHRPHVRRPLHARSRDRLVG